MRVALHACIRASAFYPRQRLQIISCSCWHTSDSWSQISHLKWLGSGNHERLWVTFLTMHRYVTHHKSWLYRAKSLRKWVIVLSLVWGIILSLDFLVERKYSSGQWSYLRWVLWATSEVNVKISFLSSFRCNVAHPTFLYCVFTLIAARSFFFFFLKKCLTSSCSQTWSLCQIGCKNLAAISDIQHLRELWYWVVALPCGVHMWSTWEAWTRWCFKKMQSKRLWQH